MASRRVLLWLIACALIAAQALGFMHRIAHLPHQQPDHHHARAAASGHEAASWLQQLFEAHADDSTCRLFDPLNHEGGPTVPAVAQPVLLASFFLDILQGEFLARWAALYDARGPPLLR
jgi:hypothetical protein